MTYPTICVKNTNIRQVRITYMTLGQATHTNNLQQNMQDGCKPKLYVFNYLQVNAQEDTSALTTEVVLRQ